MGGNRILKKYCPVCRGTLKWVATAHGDEYCTDNYKCYNIHCPLYKQVQYFKRK